MREVYQMPEEGSELTEHQPADREFQPADAGLNPADAELNPADAELNPADAELNPADTDQATVTPEPPQPGPRRPLRVALFTDNYGPGHNGLMYAVQFLERELLERDHKVLVVAPKTGGPNPYLGRPGREEYRLPSLRLPGMPMAIAGGRGFEKALDAIAANPPDIIHVQGLGPVGMLGVWAADRAEVPLMVTWHTDWEAYADHYSRLTPFLDAYVKLLRVSTKGMKRPHLADMKRWMTTRWLSRAMSRRGLINAARDMLLAADLVTTPSEKTATRVLELAPAAKVRVVPNGTDALPPGEPLEKPSWPRIIYVGRIAPEKNIGLLLDAFEWVREELPDAELMIVGDWQRFAWLKQKLKRARRRGKVTLVGQIPRDKLAPYYESGDVFVFPSLTDTQALVLHEAAHAGLPIVSVDSELRLVVDEGVNALVARPSPESLARQLVTMIQKLEDPEFRERARARSREMASWWTIPRQSADIIDLYEALAAGREIPEKLTAFRD